MHIAQIKINGMSFRFSLNSLLSVSRIAIKRGIMAIENLKNNNVVASTPFWVIVLTNVPLDPNRKPAIIGKIK